MDSGVAALFCVKAIFKGFPTRMRPQHGGQAETVAIHREIVRLRNLPLLQKLPRWSPCVKKPEPHMAKHCKTQCLWWWDLLDFG